MKYCNVCLQPDTRPNIEFSSGGICPACVYRQSIDFVDWDARRNELVERINTAATAQPRRSGFDCIIGVSGGKDSTRQALWVRENLGLNPLLVLVAYPPRQLTDRGAWNVSNLINLGFDLITTAPPPQTWCQMMRHSFLEYGNWAKSTELALFAGVPQLAIELGIPVILWGENPSLQLGDLATAGKAGWDGNYLRNMNTLGGADNSWLRQAGFLESDLIPYRYPSAEEFTAAGLQILFLGWALGDWSLVTNGLYSALSGLQPREDGALNTGDLYGLTSLDEDWVIVNQMVKYYKYGFGRATDYVNEMIRSKEITREEGCAIVATYDGVCSDHYIDSFCSYIDISIETFWQVVHGVTDPTLFEIGPSPRPTPKFTIGVND